MANHYSNKHLTEVLCSFKFHNDETVKWDIGYFGQYFDIIKDLGFKERQDRKGIQIQFSGNLEELLKPTKPPIQEIETQMLYKNPDEGSAIILGNNSISFHKTSNYTNWEEFEKKIVTPGYEAYQKLGLSKNIHICQFTYLNKFEFNANEDLADYFTLIPPSLRELGEEQGTNIDTKYVAKNNIIIVIRLFANPVVDEKRIINLECGAYGVLDNGNAVNFITVANDVHNPIRDFFEKIISSKLRNTL